MPLVLPKLLKKSPIHRTSELESLGLSRTRLKLLVKQGLLEKASRGLYVLRDSGASEHRALAEVSKRIPHGIICLLSALRFHDLTTQSPHEVWVALERSAWTPRMDHLDLRIVRFSGEALHKGHDQHLIEGVPVLVTNPAKTVADCFKYRNKIGIEVALEALREAWNKRLCTMSELVHYARICRVSNVMKPYLESVT
jgi:predicted transcriptional regulator of viral defense system